ncbi:HupE/UreJ family protein [Akkermansiaceae bacterium]|nr:HupE/UreJ family protein [Akkermansiaceae bacterium]MDA7887905.1 HupE/UreJ family protein [Akkermansiaceae bacterium]
MRNLQISLFTFILILLSSGLADAHKIDSMEFNFREAPEFWILEGEIDLTYMLPEFRGDPDAEALSRTEMMKLPPEDWTVIHEKIEKTARQLLAFTFADQAIPYSVTFPDFDKSPFALPEEQQDVALITLQISIEPRAEPGDLVLYWLDDLDAQLIIIPEETDPVIALPGGELTLLSLSASGEASAPVKSGIYGWIVSGFHHVVPLGADHILFILGIFLLCPRFKPLLGQSLLFTIAHSITLTCAVKGWVTFNTTYIEILIATSIAWIGIENLWLKKVGKRRIILIFSFGLLHGLGFASVLGDILQSTDSSHHLIPLVGFNIGVELAQVSILVVALIILHFLKSWERQIQILGSIAIAVAGILWMIERIGTLS